MHVFLIASKGIPARYGGFETFVERLVEGKSNPEIQYHVSCMHPEEKHFMYKGADCFNVKVPLPGPAGRILHVARALSQVVAWKKQHLEEDTIVYILGCRIGPFLRPYKKKLHKLGVPIYVNPDGLEWKRAKWKGPLPWFLKYCEGCLVKNADLVICDSKNIETYIQKTYGTKCGPTTYIAYGADLFASDFSIPEEKLKAWYEKWKVSAGSYYLIVGRFVPDNNYETMLREFIASKVERKLVIISNVEKNGFYEELRRKTGFEQDERIVFAGTVYDQELLKAIRLNAYGYLHGHEVGGTNPSLLEALGSTSLNLLLKVGFNEEVAEQAAIYWTKQPGSLAGVLEQAEQLSEEQIASYGEKAKARIRQAYSWESIISSYEELFSKG